MYDPGVGPGERLWPDTEREPSYDGGRRATCPAAQCYC